MLIESWNYDQNAAQKNSFLVSFVVFLYYSIQAKAWYRKEWHCPGKMPSVKLTC